MKPNEIERELGEIIEYYNTHLIPLSEARAMIRKLEERAKEPEHDFYSYANGMFCTRCGASVGTTMKCRP